MFRSGASRESHLPVSRWIYFSFIAATLAWFGIVEASLLPEIWIILLLLALLAGFGIWQHYIDAQEGREYSRTVEASKEAAYSALCGALADLDYKISARDPSAGTVRFRGGKLGPWVGRNGVDATASVRETGDRSSEITIAGRESSAENHTSPWGPAFWAATYPEAMARRAARILDRAQATVVTYSVLDSVPIGPEA
jgi:hypothetical protein